MQKRRGPRLQSMQPSMKSVIEQHFSLNARYELTHNSKLWSSTVCAIFNQLAADLDRLGV